MLILSKVLFDKSQFWGFYNFEGSRYKLFNDKFDIIETDKFQFINSLFKIKHSCLNKVIALYASIYATNIW